MSKIILLAVIFFIIPIIIKIKIFPYSEKIKLIIVLFCLILTISLNTGFMFSEYNGYNVLRIPLWFLIILGLGVTNISLKLNKENRVVNFTLILLIVNTLFWGFNITDKIKYFNFIYLYIGVFCLYQVINSFKKISLEYVINMLVVIATLNSMLGILQFILNKKLLPGIWDESIYFLEETGGLVKRIVGFAGTNNAAGAFGALLFCVVVYIFLREKKKRYILPLIFSGVFSILTLTRIGYLAIIVQIFIFYIFTEVNNKKKLLVKYLIFILGLAIVVFVLKQYGIKIYEILFLNRGYTSNYRLTQFDFAFRNVLRNNLLFGVGPGQFNRYLIENFGKIEIDLHSQYFNVLVEQGLFMFFIFLTFNIAILKNALNKHKDRLTQCFIWGIFLTGIICFNYNPNQYYLLNNLLYYTIIFCLSKLNFSKIYRKENNK